MTEAQIRPFGDRVLVRPDAVATVTASGLLVMPESVLADNPNYYSVTGVVLRLGDGIRDEDGELRHFDVQVGDRAKFNRYAGTQIEVEREGQRPERLLMLRESLIMAVVEGDHRLAPGYMVPVDDGVKDLFGKTS